MQSEFFAKWLKPGRLVPLVTILTAAAYLMLALLKKANPSIEEGFILGLLCLLAIDSLVERVSILERVEEKMDFGSSMEALRMRKDIFRPDSFAERASTIHILAISGISIARQYEGFYRGKLDDNCIIEFLLLNPYGDAVKPWTQQNAESGATEHHILSTLHLLRSLGKVDGYKNLCQVRLLEMFAPFSLIAVDLEKSTGKMIVEFHGYKTSPDQRAHIVITKRDQAHWFNSFREQYYNAWEDASKVDLETFGKPGVVDGVMDVRNE